MPTFSHTNLAVAGMLLAAMPAAGAETPDPLPSITLPDGSTLTLPGLPHRSGEVMHSPAIARGTGVVPEQAVPDAPDHPVSAAERRRQRLDELFARLAGAQDTTEAGSLVGSITSLWLESGSPTADLVMQRVLQALSSKDDKTASRLLDKLVVLRPGWAEAWNKRATVRYLQDDDAGSMEDISHVLTLEPRHFGALSGMGFIFHRNGDDKAALTVLRKAAAINPQQPEIKTLIDQLTPEVEGHDL